MNDYRLIRGARIIQQLDEDSTAAQLRQNIVTNFPKTKKRQHAINEVTIQRIEYIPYFGTQMLHIKATTSSNGNPHNQAIQFLRVTFDQNQTTQTSRPFTATDGREYGIQPILLADHNAKVRCNCLDFYHRFATWNFNDNSIVGRAPIPYQRKTTDRPEVNPNHVPGLCKHLLKVINHMRSQGIIQ